MGIAARTIASHVAGGLLHEEERKEKALKDLSAISEQVALSEEKVKQHATHTKDIENLKSILVELERDIKEKTQEHQSILRVLGDDSARHAQILQEKNTFIGEIELLKGKKIEVEKDLEALVSQHKTVSNKFSLEEQAFENSKALYNKQISDQKITITENSKKIAEQLSFLNGLIEKENVLVDSIGTKNVLHNDIDQKITSKSQEMALTAAGLEEIKKEAELRKKEIDDYVLNEKKILSSRENAVTVREGSVSEKENWLDEKEKNLKFAKLELEKFYGRKIPNVQF